jgi:hypothetical protein
VIRKIALGTLAVGALLAATVPAAEAATTKTTHVSPNASVTVLAKALHCTHVKVQKKGSGDDFVPPKHEITCKSPSGPLDIATWASHAKMQRDFKQLGAFMTLLFPGTPFYVDAGNRWAIVDNDNNNLSTKAKVKAESAYSKKVATRVHKKVGGTLVVIGG